MDLNRKLEMAKTAILSISRHDDESVEARGGVLSSLAEFIVKEHNDAHARESVRASLATPVVVDAEEVAA